MGNPSQAEGVGVQAESIGGGSGRHKASDALRESARRLHRKADGLEMLAEALDDQQPRGGVGDGSEAVGSGSYIGVGSGAEIALWEWAVSIR